MDAIANQRLCRKYINRTVEIRTVHGVYRGKIVKVDSRRVYLQTLQPKDKRKASVSFLPFILPLVLFDLLVIVLFETKPKFCHPYW